MNKFYENQLVYAYIGEKEPSLCRITKIFNNKITVSDGNHLYDIDIIDNIVPVSFTDKDIKNNKEAVNHPNHYHPGTYEAINVIEAWNLDFCLGNAIKYISRLGRKSDSSLTQKEKNIEDLKKAIWYLNRELEGMQK